jgi:hypothetical protein
VCVCVCACVCESGKDRAFCGAFRCATEMRCGVVCELWCAPVLGVWCALVVVWLVVVRHPLQACSFIIYCSISELTGGGLLWLPGVIELSSPLPLTSYPECS